MGTGLRIPLPGRIYFQPPLLPDGRNPAYLRDGALASGGGRSPGHARRSCAGNGGTPYRSCPSAGGRPCRPRPAFTVRCPDPAGRDGPRRLTPACRWTTWSATCATGSSSPRSCRSRSCCGRRSGRDVFGFTVAGAVRAARRRLRRCPEPAGGLLLGVDLLRRRRPGAAGPDARHDGARRRRGRRRLALLRRRHPHRRRRGVLRGRHAC